jgi:hypothetical protein
VRDLNQKAGVVFFVLLFSWLASAQQPQAQNDDNPDRTALYSVINALNDRSLSQVARAQLFTQDADIDRQTRASTEPWSEVTPPHFTVDSLRFLTPQLALIEAAKTQFGSILVKHSTRLLLVMKKEGSTWRIACTLPRQ